MLHFLNLGQASPSQAQELNKKIEKLSLELTPELICNVDNGHKKVLKTFEEIPMPPQWPIIGNMHLMRDYQDNHWDGLNSIRANWGDIVRMRMGSLMMVMISSRELLRECLVEKGEIFCHRPDFDRLRLIFGDRSHSLALCDYNGVHKDRRKMCRRAIIPTGVSRRHKLLERIIVDHSSNWLNDLQAENQSANESQEQEQEFKTTITKTDVLCLTCDIFLDFLAREKRDHCDPAYQRFNYGADYLFWEIQQSYLVDHLPLLAKFGVSCLHLSNLERISTELRDYVDSDVFLPRLKLHQNKHHSPKLEKCPHERQPNSTNHTMEPNQQANQNDEDPVNFLDSMISQYLSNASSLSLEDYRLGFSDLYGGHAAVSNLLMRTLGHLALKPEIQRKVHQEAMSCNTGAQHDIPNMPIAEAVVQEALRLASSPIVPHVSKEDSSLGGYFIPKETTILINNYHINRTEELWDKPLEWNPMRFIDETSGKLKLPPYFLPFSVGIRQCLGFKMVNTITTYVVSYVCKNFKIDTNDRELTEKLLTPKGSIALNPDAECFQIILEQHQAE